MKKCKDIIGIDSIILINLTDIKSYDPLEIKRKYGKFDRPIIKLTKSKTKN